MALTPVSGLVPDNLGFAGSVAVADVDGDGDPDILIGDIIRIRVLENIVGQFALHPMSITQHRGYAVSDMRLVDLDGDSDLDILGVASNKPVVFLNDGGVWFRDEVAQYHPLHDTWSGQFLFPIDLGAGGPAAVYGFDFRATEIWRYNVAP